MVMGRGSTWSVGLRELDEIKSTTLNRSLQGELFDESKGTTRGVGSRTGPGSVAHRVESEYYAVSKAQRLTVVSSSGPALGAAVPKKRLPASFFGPELRPGAAGPELRRPKLAGIVGVCGGEIDLSNRLPNGNHCPRSTISLEKKECKQGHTWYGRSLYGFEHIFGTLYTLAN